MKSRIRTFILFVGILIPVLSHAQSTVTIDGTEYWLNGINLPWSGWSDFDDPWGSNNYKGADFETAFEKYAADGINAVRVWIHCKGEGSPLLDSTGAVIGIPSVFMSNFGDMLDRAARHGLFVMPSLFSFDVLKTTKVSDYPYQSAVYFRKLLCSAGNTQSYIDKVLIPLVERFKDNPHLLAWEICNEPEWMVEGDGDIAGTNLVSWEDLQRFHGQLAAAINKNATTPVTTGAASIKWNWDNPNGQEKNRWSDSALQAQHNDPDARLDWYQVHFYDWMIGQGWHYNPYVKGPDAWGLGDRPVIIGETPGKAVGKLDFSMTLAQMYEAAYDKGYAGVFAWSDKANDGHGTYENIAAATRAFAAEHPSLVNVVATKVPPPPALISETGPLQAGSPIIYNLRGARIPASAPAWGMQILYNSHRRFRP